MAALKTVLSVAFWAFPTFFACFWMATRVDAYFFRSLEWNKKDFAAIVLPDGIDAAIAAAFGRVQEILFDPANVKYYSIRIHVALGAIMGFIGVFQLLPFLRWRFMKAHRVLGYTYAALLVPFTIEQLYTLYVVGVLPLHISVTIDATISLVAMVGGTAVGVWAAKNHKVRLHRTAMLINAAGLYVNPLQRFLWALISKNNLGGPYRNWTEWMQTLGASHYAATGACFLTALVYITVITPGPQGAKAKKVA